MIQKQSGIAYRFDFVSGAQGFHFPAVAFEHNLQCCSLSYAQNSTKVNEQTEML